MKWNKIIETNIPDGEGSWLVRLGGKYGKGRYEVFYRRKISNGFMESVAGHFVFDYLDKDCYIVAWAEIPAYKE